MSKPFRISERLKSFAHAGRGVVSLLKSEHNARIHAAATIFALAAGFLLGLTAVEWCIIIFAIILVWSAEAINTALEYLADAATPEQHPLIGKAKDTAAAAVLITAIGALIIGMIIFWPKLMQLF